MSASSEQTPDKGGHPKAARRDRKEVTRGAAMLVLAGLFIAFALLNLEQVHVNWIIGSGDAPLIIVIVISLLVGIVLTYFAERLSRKRRG